MGYCEWCGRFKPLLCRRVSSVSGSVVSLCKKCYFLLQQGLIPCRQCKGSGVVRYHKMWCKSCLVCKSGKLSGYNSIGGESYGI